MNDLETAQLSPHELQYFMNGPWSCEKLGSIIWAHLSDTTGYRKHQVNSILISNFQQSCMGILRIRKHL